MIPVHIDILTLFPGMFRGPFDESILGRAQREGLVQINIWDIRDFATDRHRTVDDTPYGGGPGMVLKPEPIVHAVEHVRSVGPGEHIPRVVLFAPQGKPFHQAMAREFAKEPWLILICGHYEGVDERVRELVATDTVSIGDYVLTGGEPAAIVFVDAVARLVPGVVGSAESVEEESFGESSLLEYPQYTRPVEFRGLRVPEILLSGHHGEIRRWRRKQSLRRTLTWRPDLLDLDQLTEEDLKVLDELKEDVDIGGNDNDN